MTRKPFKVQLQEAARFIQENDRFLVVSHVNPDGDAIGSTCAVGAILQKLNKSFVLVNEGPVPDKFHVIPMSKQIVNYTKDGLKEAFPNVIAVDAADRERMGEVMQAFPKEIKLLNIDHHPTNVGYGDYILIRNEAASTTEVLYELVQELGLEPDQELATCLYAGLMTDTGGFRYSNTTPAVMRMASALLEKEVAASYLADRLLETISLGQVKLLQRSLKSLSFAADGKISWVSVSKADLEELNVDPSDTDGIMLYPRNIEGVEVGILFKELDENHVKVSFRSKELDVAAVAQAFHGGGHVKASGCTFEGSLAEAQERVVQKVMEAMSAGGGH